MVRVKPAEAELDARDRVLYHERVYRTVDFFIVQQAKGHTQRVENISSNVMLVKNVVVCY